MLAHLRANLLLLLTTMLLCSVMYPLLLWGIGQTALHGQAQGSLLVDAQGRPIGSRLIGQPFASDEYFQPRPSAVGYNAAASGASNWAASNGLLRDRVARQLGPLARYHGGPKNGQPVAPDIENWLQKDLVHGKQGIVAQWASRHPILAQNWVKSDSLHAAYVSDWQKTHPAEAGRWIQDNPHTPEPKPEDLAVPFFVDYSKTHPGTFPCAVDRKMPDGKMAKRIEPAGEGTDIQATFFDLWLEDHPKIALEQVPADAVMASGSGLDPDITLSNALWQLDRVAAAWARRTGSEPKALRGRIEQLLREKSHVPLGGLVGVPLVNVLEVNLALEGRYSKPAKAQ